MVGISLLTLVPGQLGGTETYAAGLVRALAAHGRLEYRVFLPPVAAAAGGGLPSEVVREYGHADDFRSRALAMARGWALRGRLRGTLEQAAIVHYALTTRVPPARRPTVVTLQDVLHRDQPALFPGWERLYRRAAYDRSAREADRVIVPTAFTGRRLERLLGVDPRRIRVVPLGVDHERFRPGAEVREPVLLYPARPWPHKNHARLLDAFAQLRSERPELELVLTGGGHEGRSYPEGVVARGLVGADELVALYRRAAALVFPSLYEGFGWPPLEAMACGCPVACSAVGSLPEVVGNAARLFDPTSPEAIAAAIRDVLDAPEEWRERGLQQAARFTWAAAAEGHDAVYSELL